MPLNILLRSELGKNLKLDELDRTAETVQYLLDHSREYHQRIDMLAHKYLYNLDHSAEAGGKFIIRTLQNLALKQEMPEEIPAEIPAEIPENAETEKKKSGIRGERKRQIRTPGAKNLKVKAKK